jgi:hypothetical protein
MSPDVKTIEEDMRDLVDDCRGQCLWYLREDYYPQTRGEMLRVLDRIQRHGNVELFRKAGEIKRWLLRNSNEPFAGS